MADSYDDLPPDLAAQLMEFVCDVEGEYQVQDMQWLANFILQHQEEYPQLLNLIQIDEDAVVEYYKKTGEVPPGVKLVRTTTREGNNVVDLSVIHGSTSKKP